jgi:hypothetical protein
MQCILYKIYFWKVFHMYYNLICTPIWTKFYSCKKWVLHELLAIVHALKIWRHYLLRSLVHIYMDHKSLKYLLTQSDMNMRQQKWLELIKDYEL